MIEEDYKNFGFKYNPDITMLLYFINDAEPTPIHKDSIFMEKSIFVVFLWSQLNKIWAKFENKNSLGGAFGTANTRNNI